MLAESARHFLIAELPQRIRIERSLAVVLRNARPAALKPWGPEFFEGRAAVRLLPRRCGTLVFHYWLGASMEWPYSDAHRMIDVFLAKGAREAEVAMTSYGLTAAQIELAGSGRFDSLLEYAKKVSVSESRRKLGLPTFGIRFVGFDPNGALRGFQSVREQVEMTYAILDAARLHPDLVVVVKAHPSYPISHLRPIFKAAALANVIVIPNRAAVLDFLNSVDIVVTKYSTLLLEAALIDRIAVSALFDGEKRFDLFAGMSTLVYSGDELRNLLANTSDEVEFTNWRRGRIEQQRRALPRHYFQAHRPAAEHSAAAVIGRLAASQALPTAESCACL